MKADVCFAIRTSSVFRLHEGQRVEFVLLFVTSPFVTIRDFVTDPQTHPVDPPALWGKGREGGIDCSSLAPTQHRENERGLYWLSHIGQCKAGRPLAYA